ncbi:hypothetical protein O6H91_Y308800 [Diphasiastrum complanatum]|nr:hypothetical protein O6H91_Y308800 [Diphasiastrum complanatum]
MEKDPATGNVGDMSLGAIAGLELLSAESPLYMLDGDPLLVEPLDSSRPQPAYAMAQHEQVMTDEQLETLRRQISVYATICQQLREMHKASVSHPIPFAGFVLGQHLPYDQFLGMQKTTARQRWTPSHSQLQILERLFDQGNGTPNKQRIKEITSELSRHGQISETNVYNWFQNRKARAKRKQQSAVQKDGDSEPDTDADSPEDKKNRIDGGAHIQAGHVGVQIHRSAGMTEMIYQSLSGGHEQGMNPLFNPTSIASSSKGTVFNHDIVSGGSGFCTIMMHGKPWKILPGLVNVKDMFGSTVLLLDSQGQVLATDERGVTLHPLHAGQSYTVTSGCSPLLMIQLVSGFCFASVS